MTRTVWFNCAAGVAGDMLLASLIDAGADRLSVMDAWGALDLGGEADFAATWERVQRCGVVALWTNLVLDEHHDDHDDRDHAHGHRPADEVIAMIERADLAPNVRRRAVEVYRTLAAVEAEVHGVDPAAVELHEVGALDSILDVVGVCAAVESLRLDHITYSTIAVGHGTVPTAHGEFPNPVPAVTGLLARAGAATVGVDTTMELSTPTGVALLTVLGEQSPAMPPMRVEASGFGAGTADPQGRPNVVQAIIGSTAAVDEQGDGRAAYLVETNIDDVTGEALAHAISCLLAAGAHDAWVTPIVMKKGRPAHTLHALCDDASFEGVREAMVRETGTLGVRAHSVQRWPQRREERTVDVEGQRIRVKIAEHRTKVEHDDAAAAALALGRPLRDVLAAAETAARRIDDGAGDDPGTPR